MLSNAVQEVMLIACSLTMLAVSRNGDVSYLFVSYHFVTPAFAAALPLKSHGAVLGVTEKLQACRHSIPTQLQAQQHTPLQTALQLHRL